MALYHLQGVPPLFTESNKPLSVEATASHIAALAWMGLRHLPKKPTLLE